MSNSIHSAELIEGFADAIHQSQSCFRSILKVISEPGIIETIDPMTAIPEGLEPASWAIALTLFDADTSLWLSSSLMASHAIISNLRFHCQANIVKHPEDADYALCNHSDIPSLILLNWGSPEYPDQSTTLIIQTPAIGTEPQWRLTGPGILDQRSLAIAGLGELFQQELIASRSRFPRGIDCIFSCQNQLTALPRSTRITSGEQ